jgi:hypothetical protein
MGPEAPCRPQPPRGGLADGLRSPTAAASGGQRGLACKQRVAVMGHHFLSDPFLDLHHLRHVHARHQASQEGDGSTRTGQGGGRGGREGCRGGGGGRSGGGGSGSGSSGSRRGFKARRTSADSDGSSTYAPFFRVPRRVHGQSRHGFLPGGPVLGGRGEDGAAAQGLVLFALALAAAAAAEEGEVVVRRRFSFSLARCCCYCCCCGLARDSPRHGGRRRMGRFSAASSFCSFSRCWKEEGGVDV